jgi:hypothetical protein
MTATSQPMFQTGGIVPSVLVILMAILTVLGVVAHAAVL